MALRANGVQVTQQYPSAINMDGRNKALTLAWAYPQPSYSIVSRQALALNIVKIGHIECQ